MGNRVIEEFHPRVNQLISATIHVAGEQDLRIHTHGITRRPRRSHRRCQRQPVDLLTRPEIGQGVRGRLDRRLGHRLPPPEESRNGTASRDWAGDDGPRLRIRHRAARPRHRTGHRGDPDRQTRLAAARPSSMDQCRRDLAERRGHRTRRPRAAQHRSVTPSRGTPNPPSRICCPTDLTSRARPVTAPEDPTCPRLLGTIHILRQSRAVTKRSSEGDGHV